MYDGDKTEEDTSLNLPLFMLLIAAALALFTATLDVASYQPSAQQKLYQSECAKAQFQYDIILQPFSGSENSKVERREKSRDHVSHWCDLFAQQSVIDTARYTAVHSLWVTLLTGLGVFLIAGTLIYTRKTLIEAKTATQAAKASLNEFNRVSRMEHLPILVPSGIKSEQDSNGKIDFKIDIKNIGKGIADELEIYFAIFMNTDGNRAPLSFKRTFMETVFPQQEVLYGITFLKDYADFHSVAGFTRRGQIGVEFYCVYRDRFDGIAVARFKYDATAYGRNVSYGISGEGNSFEYYQNEQ